MEQRYPKRLIEVDLPIARISAHARREKDMRCAHIPRLHIYPAARPTGACRAVICAALWPDPVDLTEWAERGEEIPVGDGTVVIRPKRFLDEARGQMKHWAERYAAKAGPESQSRVIALQRDAGRLDDADCLRRLLLDFIADFANWDNSTDSAYLDTARTLTQAAHETLGGEAGTPPLVVDPFSGGGAIPLEALRIGCDAFASDLNPVAVLLNKVVLEYIPKYGHRLADEVRKWGEWVKERAEKELAPYYPRDPDGAVPIAYLWARIIRCEGPGCGAEVPLMRSMWLARKGRKSLALRCIPNHKSKRAEFDFIHDAKRQEVGAGTVARGSATCPLCGYTTSVEAVRQQLTSQQGGARTSRLFCVVTIHPGKAGRFYRLPTERDLDAVEQARQELRQREKCHSGALGLVPDEPLPPIGALGFRVQRYGMSR